MRTPASAALLLCLAASLPAQNPPARPSCAAPEYRQFDFWVGDWIVENPANGQRQGTNLITRDFSGCVVTEHWEGAGGSHGSSFNLFDRQRAVWHQTWVDDSGTLLLLDGRLVDSSMVLQSQPTAMPNGSRTINRITWTPMEGGRVRQHWETSADGGATWQTAFLGIYRRRP